jgi:rubrerythrin
VAYFSGMAKTDKSSVVDSVESKEHVPSLPPGVDMKPTLTHKGMHYACGGCGWLSKDGVCPACSAADLPPNVVNHLKVMA